MSARAGGRGAHAALRVAIVLPGLHRVSRGAEVAFESVARELARSDGLAVTLFGSGPERPGEPYGYVRAGNLPRERFERWPQLPVLRNEYAYEELTFVASLARRYRPDDFDVTLTCSYPFTNWFLRRRRARGRRPAHVFATQNGDHPAQSDRSEFRFFGCEGLVCTNPEFLARNEERWRCALIPNGVDAALFTPGRADRGAFGVEPGAALALMVSALIPSKRVDVAIRAAARVDGLHLMVCGDGPQRRELEQLAARAMPGRLHLCSIPRSQMPDAYRAADLLLHTSLDEPFGNAYLEALASGLPIVAHDRDVTRWILEDTGRLVDTRDEQAVADAIRGVLAGRSPEAAAAGRALVERRYAWSAIARAYRDFLGAVAAGPAGDGRGRAPG